VYFDPINRVLKILKCLAFLKSSSMVYKLNTSVITIWMYIYRFSVTWEFQCNRKLRECDTTHAHDKDRTWAVTRRCYHKTKRSGPAGLVSKHPYIPKLVTLPSSDSTYHRVGESTRVFPAPTHIGQRVGQAPNVTGKRWCDTTHAHGGDRSNLGRLCLNP
jgi:hypothetical protein